MLGREEHAQSQFVNSLVQERKKTAVSSALLQSCKSGACGKQCMFWQIRIREENI